MRLCKEKLWTWIQRNRLSIENWKREKKKHGIYNLGIENPIQIANHKNCNIKAKKLKGRKRETDLK